MFVPVRGSSVSTRTLNGGVVYTSHAAVWCASLCDDNGLFCVCSFRGALVWGRPAVRGTGREGAASHCVKCFNITSAVSHFI